MHSIKVTADTLKLVNKYRGRLLNINPVPISTISNNRVIEIALRKALKMKVYKRVRRTNTAETTSI